MVHIAVSAGLGALLTGGTTFVFAFLATMLAGPNAESEQSTLVWHPAGWTVGLAAIGAAVAIPVAHWLQNAGAGGFFVPFVVYTALAVVMTVRGH